MEIISTILTILGSIIIVAITYLLNKRNEREAEWRKEKLRFYIEFVESLSGITEYEHTPKNDARFAKASNNLYLFAPLTVLSFLRDYQDEISISNPNISQQKIVATLSQLIHEVRKDIQVKDKDTSTFIVRLWTSQKKKIEILESQNESYH